MVKAETAFRTIGEVAETLDVPQHVLRFWETRFPQIAPRKGGGGRRYYRPDDVALLTAIRKLLHVDGYTIKGVQRLLRSQGVQALRSGATPAAGDANRRSPDEPARDGGEETLVALHAEPLEAQLMALADTLDACALTLAEARARAAAFR